MELLQAQSFGWLASVGLRGWDLAIWGVIVLGVIFMWRVLPWLIRREGRQVLVTESKQKVAELIAEKSVYIDENNALTKTICNRLEIIEKILNEMGNFNNTSAERLNGMTRRLDNMKTQISEARQYSLMGVIYHEKGSILERLICFKEYLRQGGNGNVLQWAVTNLILPNKELWQSLIVKLDDDTLPEAARKNYLEKLEYIRQRVLQ